jgi:DNA-directed RNA polymerase subunit M/transcription elongation factor TFIIS
MSWKKIKTYIKALENKLSVDYWQAQWMIGELHEAAACQHEEMWSTRRSGDPTGLTHTCNKCGHVWRS